ncbi:DUF3307 domain-containing protein [Litoribacter ruber]|uniref:DUF3307 domain-containing protein n=1 Tax=Litoribacter ruber TaxID=702568 RepID=A0AAP2CIL6_9BACT|nr:MULTISPECIES: DUF3307 domain-containing protein [Litoribacter]MBS9523260.1 DUF3307 domain-containing protein [Litoribacter alkaliphilus]MBT0810577.1 DUF3307 domain-containing protein [Litoribacter ruber]
MIIFIKMILAHLIGDFLLQPTGWIKSKEDKKAGSMFLYLHVVLHGVLVFLFLWNWQIALLIAGSHYLIDVIKLYAQTPQNKPAWFLGDQLLHLTVIFGVGMYFSGMTIFPFWENHLVWLYLTAILFLTVASGIIIQVLMSKWSQNLFDGENESLTNAGKYIGILERLFVFVFVISGRWEAVGFLLTAKSVFRFGDLKESKDRKLTEYILIGTLMSFGLAIFTALLVLGMDRIQF